VTVTGFQQDVRPFLAACNAVALTSTTEALSLAAIEAMALGRPVVHSAVGGAAELIEPGHNGFVFPVGDTAALVDRLERLARPGAWERAGSHAREVAETRFSERTMVDRYEQLLSGLEMRNAHDDVRRTARAY
jgi:L-malate glycosyltransferase